MSGTPIQPEVSIAKGFLLRLLIVAPVAVAVSWTLAGDRGLWSSLYGLALVAVNFTIMILFFREGAKFGMTGLMTAAFLALLIGLGVLTAAIIPVANAHWMDLVVFGLVVILGHLAAVIIEARRVSGRLGDDGLAPWRLVK
ncbi:hypothetical protein [Ferrimicrobium sp.]|uniref:hypothetical protein n=1 Tax=Ferrimicrobium sp. TaxID=2926050 RepID=UPI00261A5E83|nr:hypothetical protein [Ferrimicrobium sp.]